MKKSNKTIFYMVAGLLFVSANQAEAINCSKASTSVEHAICANSELVNLDKKLNRLYAKAKNDLSDTEASTLRRKVKSWLRTRNGCNSDADCIRSKYVVILRDLGRRGKLKNKASKTSSTAGKVTSQYKGEKKDGKPHGKGVLTMSNGNRYVGTFENGKVDWRGVFTWANGDIYEGEWSSGSRTGFGVFIWGDDGSGYVGWFRKAARHGQGTYIYDDGSTWTGEWRNNKKYGKGKTTKAIDLRKKGICDFTSYTAKRVLKSIERGQIDCGFASNACPYEKKNPGKKWDTGWFGTVTCKSERWACAQSLQTKVKLGLRKRLCAR